MWRPKPASRDSSRGYNDSVQHSSRWSQQPANVHEEPAQHGCIALHFDGAVWRLSDRQLSSSLRYSHLVGWRKHGARKGLADQLSDVRVLQGRAVSCSLSIGDDTLEHAVHLQAVQLGDLISGDQHTTASSSPGSGTAKSVGHHCGSRVRRRLSGARRQLLLRRRQAAAARIRTCSAWSMPLQARSVGNRKHGSKYSPVLLLRRSGRRQRLGGLRGDQSDHIGVGAAETAATARPTAAPVTARWVLRSLRLVVQCGIRGSRSCIMARLMSNCLLCPLHTTNPAQHFQAVWLHLVPECIAAPCSLLQSNSPNSSAQETGRHCIVLKKTSRRGRQWQPRHTCKRQ